MFSRIGTDIDALRNINGGVLKDIKSVILHSEYDSHEKSASNRFVYRPNYILLDVNNDSYYQFATSSFSMIFTILDKSEYTEIFRHYESSRHEIMSCTSPEFGSPYLSSLCGQRITSLQMIKCHTSGRTRGRLNERGLGIGLESGKFFSIGNGIWADSDRLYLGLFSDDQLVTSDSPEIKFDGRRTLEFIDI